MDKEKILLDALNKFGNFTSVEQEFNHNQIEVIYEAMNEVLRIANVVGRSEQLLLSPEDIERIVNEKTMFNGKQFRRYFEEK